MGVKVSKSLGFRKVWGLGFRGYWSYVAYHHRNKDPYISAYADRTPQRQPCRDPSKLKEPDSMIESLGLGFRV